MGAGAFIEIPLSILFIELDHFEDELTIPFDFLTVNSQMYGILQFYMATLPIRLRDVKRKRE